MSKYPTITWDDFADREDQGFGAFIDLACDEGEANEVMDALAMDVPADAMEREIAEEIAWFERQKNDPKALEAMDALASDLISLARE